MKPPPKKRPGSPILASDWNMLVDAITARTPRPSHGMEVVFTAGGFIYRVPAATGFSVPTPPLILVRAGATSVAVTPGYVNGIMPSMEGVPLNNDPRPTLEVSATQASPLTIWIKTVGTFSQPDTYAVSIESGASLPDTTINPGGFTSPWLLGYAHLTEAEDEADPVVVVNKVYRGGNLQCDAFGSLVHWWKI